MRMKRWFGVLLVALGVLMSCPNPGGVGGILPAPANATAAALSPTSIRISWSAIAGAEGYNLYRSDSEMGDFSKINASLVTDSFYDDTGLTTGALYWYRVIAVKGGQEQTASAACCGATAPPLWAPQNVKVTYLSDSSLRVSWSAVSGTDSYNVYRSSTQYGTYAKLNLSPVITAQYDDAGLTPGTEYWYKAASVLAGVEQGQSYAVEGYTGRRWAKSYGGASEDCALSIRLTSDGGYIAAGYTMSFGAGGADFWVLKLAADGAVSWQRAYGGSAEEKASCVQQTSDGGYIVAGSTKSFGAGGSDAWIVKLTADGTVSWQKAYGSSGDDRAASVQQTADGGFIVAGTYGTSYGDFWVLKLDSDGAVIWQKRYGDALQDAASGILQTSDGGYIVAGSTTPVASGLENVWVLKLASDGSVTWQKAYGGSGVDTAACVQQTADGGYIIAGKTYSFGADTSDFWLLKLSSDGAIGWQKLCGAWYYIGGIPDAANAVQQTADGGYIVAGYTEYGYSNYQAWVVKLTAAGSVSWQRFYGGGSSDTAYSLQGTTDGGYVVAGFTLSYGAGGGDSWIMKLPGDGQLPGAGFQGSAPPTVYSSSASPSNTAVSAASTSVSGVSTYAGAQDTSAVVFTQYP